ERQVVSVFAPLYKIKIISVSILFVVISLIITLVVSFFFRQIFFRSLKNKFIKLKLKITQDWSHRGLVKAKKDKKIFVRRSFHLFLPSKIAIRRTSTSEDRISSLPNTLLCQILSYLSTEDSVRTSALSKRWTHLWLHVPALELDSSKFPDDFEFGDFFDNFLESGEEDIKRFDLVYNVDEHIHEDFVARIDDVVNRGVCHLTILNELDVEEELVRMPLSLYSCRTLVSLNLYCVVFDASRTVVVSLPRLKTMHLEAVKFDGMWLLGGFISRCSVLEELTIVTDDGDELGVVIVSSKSLKSFKLKSMRSEEAEDEGDPTVVIDAPRLEFMSITDYQSKRLVIDNIGPFAKVDIDFIFKVEDDDSFGAMIIDFLTKLSTVREMIISSRTLEMIHDNCEWELLPQFANMSHLHASFLETSWKLLLTFLGCCPNLQSLDLEFDSFPEPEEIELSFVPQCFQSSLQFVGLRTPIRVEGTLSEMKLPMLFLRNCKVLKKLMLNESFRNVIQKVRGIPKISPQFQTVALSN
ncbi:unnamed protein product, partial [Brassica napus]